MIIFFPRLTYELNVELEVNMRNMIYAIMNYFSTLIPSVYKFTVRGV